jgi:ABC-type amino acid transport substrate-binding protein
MKCNQTRKFMRKIIRTLLILAAVSSVPIINSAGAGDLDEVLQSGTLRHLGIPYANFITPNHRGLDVELMQQFAKHLGVEYRFVESTWQRIIPDLTGHKIKVTDDDVEVTGENPVKGDVISTGFTVLPWREKIVDFSATTFPTGIWLIARSDSLLTPITPTGNISKDIDMVKKALPGVSVLGLQGSCLAPSLYGIEETGAQVQFFPVDRDLEEMIPAVIAKMADATLMDVPVALVALAKWPRQIKVIGPLSNPQDMACAFSKNSPELKQAFDSFFSEFKKNGHYRKLVNTYYPTVFAYYPDFLSQQGE